MFAKSATPKVAGSSSKLVYINIFPFMCSSFYSPFPASCVFSGCAMHDLIYRHALTSSHTVCKTCITSAKGFYFQGSISRFLSRLLLNTLICLLFLQIIILIFSFLKNAIYCINLIISLTNTIYSGIIPA